MSVDYFLLGFVCAENILFI